MYGQLTQLVGFDPTPRNIAYKQSPRCVSWVNIMSDLSGLHNKGGVGEFFGVKSKSDNDNELNYYLKILYQFHSHLDNVLFLNFQTSKFGYQF